ncbi:NAD-dependent epimerase/dehydratase family protein [Anaerosinus massiliensis]|uniref:NAD-dependent epimerase/dehydratase family protein n=1 Tax=Massilibacillus massiliensis TaxID=1806837 RepID=UPI0018FE0B8B|nr:NAD(P)-dependent oxidoreductase [Massilibacillus massiliensis]
MKSVIVTGASGFLGYHLVSALQKDNVFVYAVVRPKSKTKERLANFKNIKILEIDMNNITEIEQRHLNDCECFYHLAWEGGRNDFFAQNKNIEYTLAALEIAKNIGCKRFICTGSQAEYGLCNEIITEEILPKPNTAYGSAKLATCHLTKIRAEQVGIEWVWVRVFSIYGKYDGVDCLIPYLIHSLENEETPKLTECLQNWDYLYAPDAANALISLRQKGHSGEIYNLASGDVHPLRFFVEEIYKNFVSHKEAFFGKENRMIVSLRPSIKKIQGHTGWKPQTSFLDGIGDMIEKR